MGKGQLCGYEYGLKNKADFKNLQPCRAGELNFTRSVKMKKAEVEKSL